MNILQRLSQKATEPEAFSMSGLDEHPSSFDPLTAPVAFQAADVKHVSQSIRTPKEPEASGRRFPLPFTTNVPENRLISKQVASIAHSGISLPIPFVITPVGNSEHQLPQYIPQNPKFAVRQKPPPRKMFVVPKIFSRHLIKNRFTVTKEHFTILSSLLKFQTVASDDILKPFPIAHYKTIINCIKDQTLLAFF
jgi:hypothetical protein